MTLCVAGTGVSLAIWTRTIAASLGRLLFPALVPLAVLLILGWFRLWRRFPAFIVGCMALLAVFVHLLDAAGNVVAQGDAPPQAGRYPTHWWDPGEVVADGHAIPLPADLSSGDYRVRVGLYKPSTSERMARTDAAGDAIELGPFSLSQQRGQK